MILGQQHDMPQVCDMVLPEAIAPILETLLDQPLSHSADLNWRLGLVMHEA